MCMQTHFLGFQYQIAQSASPKATLLIFFAPGTVTPQHYGARDGKVCSMVDAASKISLPAFGLASYKLKGSLLSPCGQHESEQENTLLQVADSWLGKLQVILPDYQFFLSHYSQRR